MFLQKKPTCSDAVPWSISTIQVYRKDVTTYGAFSVSQSAVPQVIDYIDRQAEHHRTMSFQEEFRLICQKHEIDERYVWD